ncbi:MAG TPA: hypothetical protein VK738_09275 [Terriglobales bacterium]|nr:hypothetical protein [Terriglobales bacterium]
MIRVSRVLFVSLFLLIGVSLITSGIFAQQPQPVQMASLRPTAELHWQRTPSSRQQSDGPVLYQLVFTPGTPGTLAKFDANPRHLINSDITDNGGIVAIGSSGFTINANTGIVNFVNSQTFPIVTSVSSGTGLTGGTITSSGTLSLDTNFTNNLYSQLAVANTFATGTQVIQTGAAGNVGLAVQGAGSQTANLEEWRDNTGTAVASVSASGVFNGDGSGLTNMSTNQFAGGSLLQHKAALLQWYRQDFGVGSNPIAIAFDGVNIWVANQVSNNVTKLRASDGALQGSFFTGATPVGLAFDGANIWVANTGGNNVRKLRASDGANLGTFSVGSAPRGVAFDGANIWVTNNGANTVTKLRASDGANQGTFAVGSGPQGIAFDGANVWVVNFGSNNVTKLRASDGALQGTFSASAAYAVVFDGANVWLPNLASNNVTKLRASDGSNLGTFSVGSLPQGVAFDGMNIWVTNYSGNNVTKLRASDGANLGTFSVGSGPFGVVSDGASIWVTNNGSNSVSRF